MGTRERSLIQAHTTLTPAGIVPEVSLWLGTSRGRGRQYALTWAAIRAVPTYAWMIYPHLPFWSILWTEGQIMSRRILDTPSIVAGKSVLDWGSGSGLIAIAAAKAGASEVFAYDTDPIAQEAIALNAEENSVSVTVLDAPPLPATAVTIAASVLYIEETARSIYNEIMSRRGEIYIVDAQAHIALAETSIESRALDGFPETSTIYKRDAAVAPVR